MAFRLRGTSPAWTGVDVFGKPVNVEAFRGRRLLLVMYFLDFSSSLPKEVFRLSSEIESFRFRSCEVIAVCSNPNFSRERLLERLRIEKAPFLRIPLVDDSNGAIAVQYGFDGPATTTPIRAVYLMDGEGVMKCTMIEDAVIPRSPLDYLTCVDLYLDGGPRGPRVKMLEDAPPSRAVGEKSGGGGESEVSPELLSKRQRIELEQLESKDDGML